MKIKVKKLRGNAKLPTYATEGSACFDLYADVTSSDGKTFLTGLAFEIPEDHVMLVYSRSGHGFKEGATLVNSVGVIDSDYRGEVAVKMTSPIRAGVGDRIAQAMVIQVDRVSFEFADELSNTERGEGGFGSTGTK